MLEDVTMDLVKFYPFPEIASVLRSRTDSILKRWEEIVRQKLTSCDELTLEGLRDDVPGVIKQMANALEEDNGGHLGDLRQASEAHGKMRFHQSFNINELLVECGLLRPILMDEVISHLNRQLTAEEIVALNMVLDAAVRRSVTEFTSFQENKFSVVNEAQSKYLSFLSHDLRGGLNGVLLMAEVLKRELAGEERFAESVEDLDAMRRSILDTVATMDRFLHAERFRQGKVEAHPTVVDIRRVLSDVMTQFAYHAKDKKLQLKLEITDGAKAITDKDLLAVIVQNLVSNAIKYTAAGEVRLVVEPSTLEDGGAATKVSIIDQGPGIAGDQLAKMFEPFTRGDTHGQPGVGLGLSIARQACELLGVKLTATSVVGSGSTFSVLLPAT